jgi:hypothetical protein
MKSVNYTRFFGNYARNPGPESVRQGRTDSSHRRRTEDHISPKECLAIRPIIGSPQETVVWTYPDAPLNLLSLTLRPDTFWLQEF